MQDAHTVAGDRLRAAGLRSTPQRRAILAAFTGHPSEHLSADEVYALASALVPDLGRGTVYATLAEFSEVGLLAAYGASEPMRYETNTLRHAHFRCRICLRVFDVTAPELDPAAFVHEGHHVETLDLRADGTCCECTEFEAGLHTGVRAITRAGVPQKMAGLEVSALALDSPLDQLLIAATETGIIRVAFAHQGDSAALTERVDASDSAAIHRHLAEASSSLGRYFAGEIATPEATIDWEVVGASRALRAPMDIPSGVQRSYHLLATGEAPRVLGRLYGANPIALLSPCHRVTRGSLTPDTFVGGPQRREWLLAHERR